MQDSQHNAERTAGGHVEIAIITGASSGIGREFAAEIDRLNVVDEIWIVGRNLKRLDETRESLQTTCVQFPLDLTKKESFKEIEEELVARTPIVRYLVNAAGYGKFGDIDEVTNEDAEGMIELNTRALVSMTNLARPYMVNGTRILNMGSIAAYLPLPDFAVYAASKAFVVNYSYAIRSELMDKGIGVTVVCPHWVDTAFFDRAHNPNASRVPKKLKPMSSAQSVVKKALKAAETNRALSINRFSTKCMHVLSKLLPRKVLIFFWRGKQKRVKYN